VFPKTICIDIEFTLEEIEGILNFLNKAIPLYVKVYSDGPIDELELVNSEFKAELERIVKTVKGENKDVT